MMKIEIPVTINETNLKTMIMNHPFMKEFLIQDGKPLNIKRIVIVKDGHVVNFVL